jgi:hypothetical protein
MAPGIGKTSRPSTQGIQPQPNVSEAAKPGQVQGPGPTQTPKGGPTVSTDQYGSARGPGANPTAGPSLQVPDKLNRSSQSGAAEDRAVTLPEDTIKAADQKVVDRTTKQIEDLVKKGDDKSLKNAVDKLFDLKEPELAATLQRLHESGALKDLIKGSNDDNNARLQNTVNGHGSADSKKILAGDERVAMREIAEGFGIIDLLKKEKSDPNKDPTGGWLGGR